MTVIEATHVAGNGGVWFAISLFTTGSGSPSSMYNLCILFLCFSHSVVRCGKPDRVDILAGGCYVRDSVEEARRENKECEERTRSVGIFRASMASELGGVQTLHLYVMIPGVRLYPGWQVNGPNFCRRAFPTSADRG